MKALRREIRRSDSTTSRMASSSVCGRRWSNNTGGRGPFPARAGSKMVRLTEHCGETEVYQHRRRAVACDFSQESRVEERGDMSLPDDAPNADLQAPEAASQGRPRRQPRSLDILLVEDESAIAKDIEYIVRDLGHRVIGPARTQDEALSLAAKARPAVIIADVKLADGSSGVVAVDEMLKTIDASVIFVTAVPEWLRTGGVEPYFVIPKPYATESVQAAVQKAASRRAQEMPAILATKSAVSRLMRRQ
ncbi:MAG: hypothetical protein CTY15_13520 [Methylocystis sp.]|nr:MAG: hypothetical protein CTY15_13520 [Methylocystis sp.]